MSEQNSKVPKITPSAVKPVSSSSARQSGTVVTAETQLAPSEPGRGLKVVTVSPGSISMDMEVTSSQRHDPYLGSTIDGRYKVEALLGEGGMGVVYRCTHTIIGKKVAMKVLRADLARDAEVTERFLNEAKAASTIGNAHIIDISDFGQFPDGATYFVMEFLNGQPLSKVLEGGQPLPVSRIIHMGRQLAEGLSAAHASGIVHRDLKPDNIFLIDRGGEKDFIKILDFGIAKVSTSSEAAKLTRAGAVFGTPHYMSPEQAAGQPVDHRGDVYSFGVILYEMASGRVPFDADNFMGILTQHMYKSPVPIRALVPQPQDVPPGLEAIVLKCLSKRPDHRYQSMDEMIAEFDKLKQGAVPDAVPEMMSRSGGFNVPADYFMKGHMPAPVPATPAQHSKQKSRWPLFAGLAGVLAAVGIVAAIFAKSSESGAHGQNPVATTAAPVVEPIGSGKAASNDDITLSKQVALGVEPARAHIFRDGKDLGTSPVVIDIEEGKLVQLDIKLNGYKDKRLVLDGSQAKVSVALESSTSRPAARPVQPKAKPDGEKPPPKKKPGIGGSEIVNPWN